MMAYTYMTPQDVWYGHEKLVGNSLASAYWARWWDSPEQNSEMYKFRFRVLRSVTIGPHAYTLWFDDGFDELISYDIVCVYTVDLNKS